MLNLGFHVDKTYLLFLKASFPSMNRISTDAALMVQLHVGAAWPGWGTALSWPQQLRFLGNKVRPEAFLISTGDKVPNKASV